MLCCHYKDIPTVLKRLYLVWHCHPRREAKGNNARLGYIVETYSDVHSLAQMKISFKGERWVHNSIRLSHCVMPNTSRLSI